jgi:hypothetical protein
MVERLIVKLLAALAGAIAVAACGAHTGGLQNGQNQTTVQNLNQFSADDLVAVMARAGLAVPNPRDVTQRDCPQIGCASKVDTDTVSIMKFLTPGRAELYAGSIHDRFLIEDVVVSFSPAVPAGARTAYESAVKRAIE